MKGYGLPRNDDVAYPDVADIHLYGLKTSVGSLSGRSLHKSSAAKRRARRIWKKAARRQGRREAEGGLEERYR